MDFKNIHIGKLIEKRAGELKMDTHRICSFFGCDKKEITEMYMMDCLHTKELLKWSKLLKYDFFRIYSQYLILHSPPLNPNNTDFDKRKISLMPQFRKNIYSKEIIDFILEQISSGKKNKLEVMNEYGIPKTTLYKWIAKNQEIDKK